MLYNNKKNLLLFVLYTTERAKKNMYSSLQAPTYMTTNQIGNRKYRREYKSLLPQTLK